MYVNTDCSNTNLHKGTTDFTISSQTINVKSRTFIEGTNYF